MSVDSFHSFCELCKNLADEPSYNNKTAIIKRFVTSKSTEGNLYFSFSVFYCNFS